MVLQSDRRYLPVKRYVLPHKRSAHRSSWAYTAAQPMTNRERDSHIFTIRVWMEELEEGRLECRGRLHHGPRGPARHFQGWAALVDLMNDMVQDLEDEQSDQP